MLAYALEGWAANTHALPIRSRDADDQLDDAERWSVERGVHLSRELRHRSKGGRKRWPTRAWRCEGVVVIGWEVNGAQGERLGEGLCEGRWEIYEQ